MPKFKWGKIPLNTDFDPEQQGWSAIKEPSPWLAQLIALPFGILAAVLMEMVWVRFTLVSPFLVDIGLSTFGWALVVVVLHEFIHALLHPKNGISSESVLGFWPSRVIFYAHYNGTLSKKRFLTVSIGPFILLSFIPLFFCAIFRCASLMMFGMSVLNSLIASVDFLAFLLIIFQVPSKAMLQNKGWRTYYRIADTS